jgi:hypothetical protein
MFATELPLVAISGKHLTQCFGELKGLQRICGKVAASLRQTFLFGTACFIIMNAKFFPKKEKKRHKPFSSYGDNSLQSKLYQE